MMSMNKNAEKTFMNKPGSKTNAVQRRKVPPLKTVNIDLDISHDVNRNEAQTTRTRT